MGSVLRGEVEQPLRIRLTRKCSTTSSLPIFKNYVYLIKSCKRNHSDSSPTYEKRAKNMRKESKSCRDRNNRHFSPSKTWRSESARWRRVLSISASSWKASTRQGNTPPTHKN